MKFFLILTLSTAVAAHAVTLLENHTDLVFNYSGTTQTWSGFLQYGGTVDNPTLTLDPDLGALVARDQDYPNGERLFLPPGYEFTGAIAGQPYWIFPQDDIGYTWPGFRNSQPASNPFDSYLPNDPRISLQAKWMDISLISVVYSGAQQGTPHFSLWQETSSGPIVWMATSNGISLDDVYYLREGSHSHLNWGFGGLGVYRITFRPSARVGGQIRTGETFTFTFAVGTMARWRTQHFTGSEITDPSIGVPEADPDGDDCDNVLEYAFNMNPNIPSRSVLPSGTGVSGLPNIQLENISGQNRLTLEYVRRKSSTNPQITYTPEFTSDLQSSSWQAGTNPVITSIDATWERVKVMDPQVTAPGTNRFGRVRVTIQPTLVY